MWDPCSGSGLPALLAAVLPEVVGQSAKRAILGGVIVECALLATHEQASAQQAFQVMAECRSGGSPAAPGDRAPQAGPRDVRACSLALVSSILEAFRRVKSSSSPRFGREARRVI